MIGSKNKIAQHRAASRLSCCKMGFDPILHVHLNIYVDFVGYFIVVYTMSYRESLDVWNLIFLGFQLLSSGVIRDWQIFGHGSDFPTWSEAGTKSEVKSLNFDANFEPSYLWTGKSF